MIDIGESSLGDRCMTEQARKCYIIMKAEY